MTYIELAEKIIRNNNQPLSPAEIWEIALEKKLNNELASVGKTPIATLGARIYVDMKDNKEKSKFIKIRSKPVRFYLKDLPDIEKYKNMSDIKSPKLNLKVKERMYTERDLHKLLSFYVYNYFKIYTKTILHEESSKKKFAQWLHPDIVGVHFPIEDLEDEVFDIAQEIGNQVIKLYSFEMKKALSFDNIREAFFQAVSNSSWANEGYLVAAEIDQDDDFILELKRLSTSFGIGIIKLDVVDPDSSEVLFNPKIKESIDLETVNKITEINPQFREFLKRVKTDLNSKEPRKEKYDKIFESNELAKFYK